MADFTHPQQVRDALAASIGEDVFNQMEAQDPLHNGGNPLPQAPDHPEPAAAPAAPAPAAPAPSANPTQAAAPAPAAPADSAPQPVGQPATDEKGLLLGKYARTPEGERFATDSYHQLLRANKELLARAERAEGKPIPMTPSGVRTEPVPAAVTNDAYKAFAEKYNVDPEDIAGLVRAEAQRTVDAVMKPRDAYVEADQFMASKYPESVTLRDELVQYVQSNPDVAAVVQKAWDYGDYKGALEIGWNRYEIARRAELAQQERGMVANQQVRTEEVQAARKDAGLITSQVSGVHAPEGKQYAPDAARQAELERLWRAGHREPWLRENIGSTLPDELFGVGGGS
jgi:hypothetical protein